MKSIAKKQYFFYLLEIMVTLNEYLDILKQLNIPISDTTSKFYNDLLYYNIELYDATITNINDEPHLIQKRTHKTIKDFNKDDLFVLIKHAFDICNRYKLLYKKYEINKRIKEMEKDFNDL